MILRTASGLRSDGGAEVWPGLSAPPYHYERLAAESASFLMLEGARRYMHAITVQIFEPGPLALASAGVDFGALREATLACLPRLPRYRQRLKWVPFEDYPVWVDDADFQLDYHLRHTALPRPGGAEELSRIVGRIMSQRLDRARPLWECWVVEGVGEGRFAIVLKTHHSLLDEGSSEDLLQALLSTEPDAVSPTPPAAWEPRPAPSRLEVGRDELLYRARLPQRAAQRFWSFARESGSVRSELRRRVAAVTRLSGFTLRERTASPFGGSASSHRRVEHLALPLRDAVAVRRTFGTTVNDVLLAVVAGAVRSFLQRRFVKPTTLDLRIAVPVRVQGPEGGSETSRWILELPIWERDPVERLAHVREQTERLHRADPALAASTLFSVAEWSGSRLLTMGARRLASRAPADLELNYVPGPQVPLYLRGARLLESYGQTPLRKDSALGISVMSYGEQLYWGLNADFRSIQDLATLKDALRDELARLLAAASASRGGATPGNRAPSRSG